MGLAPLPDAPGELPLGSLDVGASIVQRVTIAVRYNQGFASRAFLRVLVRGDKHNISVANAFVEPCCPYHLPIYDVLLLYVTTAGACVDVFRRRGDQMRARTTFHVVIGHSQTSTLLLPYSNAIIDVCVREAGRLHLYSHVSTFVADSFTLHRHSNCGYRSY